MKEKEKRQRVKEEAKKISDTQLEITQQTYNLRLNSDKEYSLEIDPCNIYNMSKLQKQFIDYYIQYKNINTVSILMNIEPEEARKIYVIPSTQQEIVRLTRALYHHQFRSKILNLDQIGGYLTSLITDENVPIADRLTTVDKLKVVKCLLEVIALKKEAMIDPETIANEDLSVEIKNLSVDTISSMLKNLNKKKKNKNQDEIIVEENDNSLTKDEEEYLRSLPASDLLHILNDSTAKKE